MPIRICARTVVATLKLKLSYVNVPGGDSDFTLLSREACAHDHLSLSHARKHRTGSTQTTTTWRRLRWTTTTIHH